MILNGLGQGSESPASKSKPTIQQFLARGLDLKLSVFEIDKIINIAPAFSPDFGIQKNIF